MAAVRMTSKTPDPKTLTDADWRAKLSREEYNVLRQAGTERPGTGEYDNFYPKGEAYFACRGCGNPLYSGESKFKSGCGWPAFDKCYKDAVRTKVDNAFGMRRVEILCGTYLIYASMRSSDVSNSCHCVANCDGHLGHVFEGERFTETNERHCVNSVSLSTHSTPGLPERLTVVYPV